MCVWVCVRALVYEAGPQKKILEYLMMLTQVLIFSIVLFLFDANLFSVYMNKRVNSWHVCARGCVRICEQAQGHKQVTQLR